MSDSSQAAALGLTAHQVANARGIIRAVKARGWPKKAAVIAVETALTESGLRILASANVPASQNYPHDLLSWTDDGMGHDHASMGMYQQQTGTAWTPAGHGWAMNQTTMTSADGWGPPSVLMDAERSTALFLNALARVDWRHLDNWAAAQAVQHSAFADGSNYRGQDARAHRIVDALWGAGTASTKDWLEELMGLYDPDRKLTAAEQREKANFEKALTRIVWSQVRKPWVSDDGARAHRLSWHLRRLVPGTRATDGTK